MPMNPNCAADGRPEPSETCSRGRHLWLKMGDHEHVGAEHGRIADVQCWNCHEIKPCRGTIGEARAREAAEVS